jgi:pimeloyl-ACP methyl ester carboxylesterase
MKLLADSMQKPSLHFVDCSTTHGVHRMAYWQWGRLNADHMVLCVHGLTRQGRDFDVLAQALLHDAAGDVCVICPDVVGRGHSDWLAHAAGYQTPTYVADMLTLVRQLQPRTLDWVGTSMGGLIGMAAAAPLAAQGLPIRRLVLNDVGPAMEWPALQRIASYVGHNMQFASLEQGLRGVQFLFAGFGALSDAQWRALSLPMLKAVPNSDAYVLHYDPVIGLPFQALTKDLAQQAESIWWQVYDALPCQTLLLRGADSDLLSALTSQQMTQRGPRASLMEFAGVGHAPSLVVVDQVDAIVSFLR